MKLNRVGYSTVIRTDEFDEDEEEVEGKVLGVSGDEVIIMPVV